MPNPTTRTPCTLRSPPYTYIRLSLRTVADPSRQGIRPSSKPPLDPITIHQQVVSALRSYSGLHGTAIPIDILRVDPSSDQAWIRVPREDAEVVAAAVSCWTGRGGATMMIEGRGSWLGALGGMGREERQRLWSLEK